MLNFFSKLYSEYLVIPRAIRLVILWGWVILFIVTGIQLGWFRIG
ncbi:hypothetical protein [Paenibacillus tundrae]|uniref:Uncharacterized protein n=1 Tax=Paenibacillus tundrae TaxID=528187 RepID=A0ABT9WE33_9BACL|nr:hypothetical protein [Paenibacillus tundrae]MDQ0171481.1 hypothetical protein [Paenibacillus tundrae]